jgi:hypothetical protein
MRFWTRILHDQPAGRGLAGEGDLGDARLLTPAACRPRAEAVDDVEHARRQQVAISSISTRIEDRRLLGGLQHHAVAGRQRRGQLPRRHQDREVPGDDLPDHAERLVEVIGHGVVVELGQRAFLARMQPAK